MLPSGQQHFNFLKKTFRTATQKVGHIRLVIVQTILKNAYYLLNKYVSKRKSSLSVFLLKYFATLSHILLTKEVRIRILSQLFTSDQMTHKYKIASNSGNKGIR